MQLDSAALEVLQAAFFSAGCASALQAARWALLWGCPDADAELGTPAAWQYAELRRASTRIAAHAKLQRKTKRPKRHTELLKTQSNTLRTTENDRQHARNCDIACAVTWVEPAWTSDGPRMNLRKSH